MADNEPQIEAAKIESPKIDDSFKVRPPGGGGRRGKFSEEPVSDYDGQPGSFENSRSYDRIYNPEGENEQTHLLENANEIELANILRRRRAALERGYAASLAAQSQVQFWHGVGKFITPEDNSYMAHFDLVDHGPTDLHFDPKAYPLFDKIIADHARIPALSDPNHPHYGEYEGLRNNIAVLRNFVFTDTFKDGSFDPGDELHIPRIVGIAQTIGDGLRNDSWLGRVFTPAVNVHLAKVPGEGAVELYEHLVNNQHQRGPFAWIKNIVLQLFSQPLRDWDLPPVSETPFSEAGMNAPSPHSGHAQSKTPEAALSAAMNASVTMQASPAAPTPPPARDHKDHSSKVQDARATIEALQQIAQELDAKTKRFKQVSEMEEPAREESVELAREILRKLRNMRFDDQEMEALLDQAAPKRANNVGVGIGSAQTEENNADNFLGYDFSRKSITLSQKIQDIRARKTIKQAEKIAQIIEVYTAYLEQARETRPDIAETPAVKQANEAVEEYIHSIKLMASKEIPSSIAAAQQIGADQTLDPSRWDELHNRATDRLMASIESGMEELVSELDQQEMDQEKENDELAQAAVESSLMHSDQQRRKRRRRRQQQSSGYGGKSQLKKHLAITADDFVLKQGAHREIPEPERPAARSGGGTPTTSLPSVNTALAGLRTDALSAVHQIGNSLKQATENGKELQENLDKQLAEQRAQEANNPAAPQSATQALNSERDRTRRNNPNRRTT